MKGSRSRGLLNWGSTVAFISLSNDLQISVTLAVRGRWHRGILPFSSLQESYLTLRALVSS